MAMMLLQYFIWGSWYVTMNTYMSIRFNASGAQIGGAFSALAIATMISPLFIGMVADRYFAAQRVMGVLHLAGGALLFLATRITDVNLFYWVILAYSLVYMPTIALSNSIAFHQMSDPGKQFPWIRVFGTVGWIAAGLLIDAMGISQSSDTFYLAALTSVLLGLMSFTLPETPPKGVSGGSIIKAIGGDALILLKQKSFLVFFICAILVCIPLSFYYGFANLFLVESAMTNVTAKMTMGQFSEAVFILAIPFLFNRIGVKNMLILGMTAWIARYVCFAFGNNGDTLWMLYAGILLHGICYDFFFVTGYMYTEQKAAPAIKNAAQGLFTFATYGIGMWIGTNFSGITTDMLTSNGVHDWYSIWMVPATVAVVVLIAFAALFREERASA